MSQENVEVVRSMYAGFSELARGGELASFVAEHWDPDCEYEPVEETATIRGHDALIRWAERWLEAWEEYWDEIEEIIDVGSRLSLQSRSMAEVAIAGCDQPAAFPRHGAARPQNPSNEGVPGPPPGPRSRRAAGLGRALPSPPGVDLVVDVTPV